MHPGVFRQGAGLEGESVSPSVRSGCRHSHRGAGGAPTDADGVARTTHCDAPTDSPGGPSWCGERAGQKAPRACPKKRRSNRALLEGFALPAGSWPAIAAATKPRASSFDAGHQRVWEGGLRFRLALRPSYRPLLLLLLPRCAGRAGRARGQVPSVWSAWSKPCLITQVSLLRLPGRGRGQWRQRKRFDRASCIGTTGKGKACVEGTHACCVPKKGCSWNQRSRHGQRYLEPGFALVGRSSTGPALLSYPQSDASGRAAGLLAQASEGVFGGIQELKTCPGRDGGNGHRGRSASIPEPLNSQLSRWGGGALGASAMPCIRTPGTQQPRQSFEARAR